MTRIRALLFTAPLIVLATVVYGSINLLVSLFDPTGRKQLTIARAWARALLAIGGVRLHVQGLDKIDAHGSYVFVANHLSYMDTPVVLSAIPVQLRFLAKKGLFRIPFLGHHLKRAGHVPVSRDNPREALRAMSEAGQIVRQRRISLLVFPEGGRSRYGQLRPFKEGAALIAIKAGVPVVPVALVGTREILPMGSMEVRPGRVEVRIGDPIPTEGLTPAERSRLTSQLYDRVRDLLEARTYTHSQ